MEIRVARVEALTRSSESKVPNKAICFRGWQANSRSARSTLNPAAAIPAPAGYHLKKESRLSPKTTPLTFGPAGKIPFSEAALNQGWGSGEDFLPWLLSRTTTPRVLRTDTRPPNYPARPPRPSHGRPHPANTAAASDTVVVNPHTKPGHHQASSVTTRLGRNARYGKLSPISRFRWTKTRISRHRPAVSRGPLADNGLPTTPAAGLSRRASPGRDRRM